jgi:glycine dehydrogenase subunit 2
MGFHQATWEEPLIIERSQKGKIGYDPILPTSHETSTIGDPLGKIPKRLVREADAPLPELSEPEVVRHFTRLSQENYTPDVGIYPLGSCTMKYNPKISEIVVQTHKLEKVHPEQDESTVQGILELMYRLDRILSDITGMSRMSLQPAAGAHGEFLGALIIRAHHMASGESDGRTEMIIPDSAHGTNPASAAMAGFRVVVVPSDSSGMVDTHALRKAVGPKTAGLMITNPNTLGIFERNIVEIARTVHDSGGLLYYDGANFNPILGKVRPGDMGFDIVHLNLHKTFATPHGGGGPGAGPVGVTKRLEGYLPVPLIAYDGKKYFLDYDLPDSVGKIRAFHGNVGVLVRAYTYIMSLGIEGLESVAETAVLNTNYVLAKMLKEGLFELPFSRMRKHEFVLSAKKIAEKTGVRALDIAKRMLDKGVHAPTVYFPLVVEEAMMVETPETESLYDLDKFVEAMVSSAKEAEENPEVLRNAPHATTVGRIDDVKASHPKTIRLRWENCSRGVKQVLAA